MTSLPRISVDGSRVADEAGDTVVLTGRSPGGWLNLEDSITGHAAVRKLSGVTCCERWVPSRMRP
jgi:hypothetical protein